MPIFTAAAAAIGSFFAGITVSSVAAFAVRTLVTIGISKLVANRANKSSAGASDVGARVQLGPATNNKLAVSYGSAFLAPAVTDAKITTDQKTMYYVFSLCEASSGTMSFGKIFWNGKEVTLGAGDYSANNKVVSLTTNATTPQVDTTINGCAWIYQFNNGSSSGINTGGTSAITILQNTDIPVSDRWTSTDVMTDTCFMVVKVVYNKDVQDAQQMPRLSVQLTNTLTKPGDVIYDYMTDVQYGCAIDPASIDSASITALNAYSDELITYVPIGGGTTTQARYRIDGPVNTGDNCLSNLQQLVDACDSWLQYSELLGQWTIVINKPYSGVIGDLYSVDSSVLIGGIDINPIDLNQTYNSLEVQYPNANINDQTDYKVVDLTTVGTAWYDPSLLSPNEPDNRLVIQYPQINNYIRAVYLGVRRLLQSREDLTIVCNLDYSGIQVVAGDVVRVTLAEYGWADKLFRVSQVQETKTGEGFLGARITAFEYNGTIYADNALQDFIPEANTGLSDPNIFDKPSTPIVTLAPVANGAINYFTVSSNVPATGTTLYMDFNYGNTSNVASHKSYSTLQLGNGAPYTANTTLTLNVADLNPATYYWSTSARNDLAGRQSNSSSAFVWAGPSVSTYNANTGNGGIVFSQISSNVEGVSRKIAGVNFSIPISGSGNGVLAPVSVTTSTINIPVTIPAYPIVSTNFYPPFQNTSSNLSGTSGNNFYANSSTGTYGPKNSWTLLIASGDDNWWDIVKATWANNTFQTRESLRANIGLTLFADANSIVQVVQGITYNGFSYSQYQMDDVDTIQLYQYQPKRIEMTTTFYDPVSNSIANIVATTTLIRNISGGNVTVVKGSMNASAAKWPF
jgi:lipopolysaccharide export system protein LptA